MVGILIGTFVGGLGGSSICALTPCVCLIKLLGSVAEVAALLWLLLIETDERLLVVEHHEVLSAVTIIIIVVWELMVDTIAVTGINHIRVSIYVDSFTAWPRELVALRRVLLHFLVDFDFEFLEFLFYFVIDMPLIDQEVIREVLLLLLGVIDVLTQLSDMVDGRLNHSIWSDVLAEGLVSL